MVPVGLLGVAQVDEVYAVLGQFRHKAVLFRTGQVGDVAPRAAFLQHASSSAHDVAVHVDRIDGVGDGHAVVPAQQFADASRVALGAVVDEDFGGREVDAAWGEVVLQDGLDEEVVALFGAVAAEGLRVCHLVHSLVHGFDAGGWQGAGDVADAQADDVLFGMGDLERVHLLGDVGEEVAAGQLQEMFVY